MILMKQKAALLLSIAALAVTGYLCLSPSAEQKQKPDTSLATSDQSPEPALEVKPNESEMMYFADLEKAKQLLERDPFLYPTDQMFRLFEQEAEPRR
jgi:hypothetical protein